MSQEDQVISSESEAEVTLRGSEEGESGSEAEFEHLRRDSGSPAHNQAHSSFLVQLKTQATDGDGHGVSQARLVGASPSSTLGVHVDQGQERPRPVDDVILIRPHTETSHIRKTSWSEDSIYPLEAMTRFESAMTIALQGGGRSDALVWPWLNRYLGLVLWKTNESPTEPTPVDNPGTRYWMKQRAKQSPVDLAIEVGATREYFLGYPNEDHDLRYKAWMWLHDQQKSDLLDTLTLGAAPNHHVEPLIVQMQSSSSTDLANKTRFTSFLFFPRRYIHNSNVSMFRGKIVGRF